MQEIKKIRVDGVERSFKVSKRYIRFSIGLLEESEDQIKWTSCEEIKKESFQKDLENKLKKK